ncbi:hypothetical protein OsJ_19713 [Oryza sativa Japonica Group]|uniref:Uncharacterized protein n=1 Tax=Oryza sativa subsp. japonica TaxID=39947 RepID=B9FLU5_ORYSJ|nr:hypothetical protein OsJ_19713 [Oryza sativa Japonica Group]
MNSDELHQDAIGIDPGACSSRPRQWRHWSRAHAVVAQFLEHDDEGIINWRKDCKHPPCYWASCGRHQYKTWPLLVLCTLLVSMIEQPITMPSKMKTDNVINDMVLRFVSMTRDPPLITGDALALHPIDVCHRSLLHGTPPPPPPSTGRKRQREDEFVPSVTELEQAGVHFSRSPTRSLRDISFRPGDDVRLLSGGVVSNGLGSDKAVARMFNRLAKNAVLDRRSPLRGVQGQVNDHRENAWNEWWATAGAEGGAATGRGKLLSSSRASYIYANPEIARGAEIY